MEKITKFDKTNLKQVRDYLDIKFVEMFDEIGVKFSIGNITFDIDGLEFRTTLTAKPTILNEKGEQLSEDKVEWDKYCWQFELKKEDFGKVLKFNGQDRKICGIKKYGEKNTVVICDPNDTKKRWVTSHNTINRILGRTDRV